MTKNSILLGVAFISILLFAPGSAAGQDSKIALYNRTTGQLKICFYGGNDSIAIIPQKCYTIASNQTLYIEQVEKEYRIRVYLPALIDQHLYSYKLANIYEEISFGAREASFKTRPKPPNVIAYILKVCNQTSANPVYFVLSFDDGKTLYSKGWWVVNQNQCKDFPVSRMLYDEWKVDYGTLPRTHYYARTYAASPGASHIVWAGGSSDQQNCIQTTKEFKTAVVLRSISEGSIACENNKFTNKVRMRRLPDPKVTDQYYYLTF
jgi:uncharacterized membrane protein